MVVRHWRGVAHRHNAEAYLDHLRRAILPRLRELDGYRGSWVLRRDTSSGVEFVVSWDSLDSVRGFAGDDYETAVVPPDAREVLASFDDRVTHYDVVVDTTPAGSSGGLSSELGLEGL